MVLIIFETYLVCLCSIGHSVVECEVTACAGSWDSFRPQFQSQSPDAIPRSDANSAFTFDCAMFFFIHIRNLQQILHSTIRI